MPLTTEQKQQYINTLTETQRNLAFRQFGETQLPFTIWRSLLAVLGVTLATGSTLSSFNCLTLLWQSSMWSDACKGTTNNYTSNTPLVCDLDFNHILAKEVLLILNAFVNGMLAFFCIMQSRIIAQGKNRFLAIIGGLNLLAQVFQITYCLYLLSSLANDVREQYQVQPNELNITLGLAIFNLLAGSILSASGITMKIPEHAEQIEIPEYLEIQLNQILEDVKVKIRGDANTAALTALQSIKNTTHIEELITYIRMARNTVHNTQNTTPQIKYSKKDLFAINYACFFHRNRVAELYDLPAAEHTAIIQQV